MKKKLLVASIVLIFSLLVSTAYKNVNAQDYAKENNELNQKNEKDQKKIKDKQKDIEKKKEENKQIEKKIEEIGQKISSIAQEIAVAETKLSKLKKEVKESEIKLTEATNKAEKIRDEMKLRIQYMYENSYTNMLILFFQMDSFSEFLNSAEYQTQIAEYDRKKFDEYVEVVNTIKKVTDDLKKLENEQRISKEKLEKDKTEANNLVTEQKTLIEKNKRDISEMSEEIKKLTEEIEARNEEIRANIKKAQEELEKIKNNPSGSIVVPSDISNNTPSSSGYIWPLPTQYRTITSPFDKSRRFSAADYVIGGHLGVDIYAPTGTPIYAARAGIVVQSGWGSGGTGNMVCILQDDGRLSRYMHMSSIAVSANTAVAQGAIIGYVGQTGYASGPHLHFQVETDPNSARWGETAFDPLILY